MLACSEVKPQLDKMLGLKRDKGMAGIHDLIDWTLAQVEESFICVSSDHYPLTDP